MTRFSPVIKDRIGRPKTAECGYSRVEIDSTPYLVLEIYGAADRTIPGNVSQGLHLDRDHATQLKSLLEQQFPGI